VIVPLKAPALPYVSVVTQIGGRDVPRAYGASHGEGVYTSTTVGGAKHGAGCVILSRALNGAHGTHGTTGVHSWSGGGTCIVFKDTEQLLPVFVVRCTRTA
jgi:hypothetical protein